MTTHNPDSALYEKDRQLLRCVYRADRAPCHPDRTRSSDGNSGPDLTNDQVSWPNVVYTDQNLADMEEAARQLRAIAASPDTPLFRVARATQRAERMEEIIAKHREPRIVNPRDVHVTSRNPDVANHNPNLTDCTAGCRNVLMTDRHVAAREEEARRIRATAASAQTPPPMDERTGQRESAR